MSSHDATGRYLPVCKASSLLDLNMPNMVVKLIITAVLLEIRVHVPGVDHVEELST
jgi:hypothetical protein